MAHVSFPKKVPSDPLILKIQLYHQIWKMLYTQYNMLLNCNIQLQIETQFKRYYVM